MVARTLRGPGLPARAAWIRRSLPSPGALALAAALPVVFLHVENQPGFTVEAGSASAHVALSDLAVLAVGVLAAATALHDPRPLRPGLAVWAAGAALLALVFAASFYPLLRDEPYAWQDHLVTAGKFAEYALLALAVPLLVRGERDLRGLLAVLVAWSAAATVFAVAQFAGADIAGAWGAGRRQPSFLGHHDFAALSGATGALGLAAIALGASSRLPRALSASGGVAGGLGLVLSGSSAGAIGFAAGAVAIAIVARLRAGLTLRRLAALAAVTVSVCGGVALLRGGDVESFLRWLGALPARKEVGVETYVHRTLLAYIGWRIFLDHPVAGVGWQGSKEAPAFGPYLDDARREFPDAPAIAFPSSEHPWGVQNAYVQALADLGAIGLALFLGLLGSGLFVAGRIAVRGPPASTLPAVLAGLWLLTAMGVWAALGLVAGLPVDGLTWLALGLAVLSAGLARETQ